MKRLGILLAAIFLIGASTPPPKAVDAPNQPAAEQAEQPAAQDPHPEGFWQRAQTDPVAAFTLVLAGFTGILTVATVLLWLETKTAIIDSRKASERELRAYVMVTLKGARMPPKKQGSAYVEVYNRGQTPAHDICVQWALGVFDTLDNEAVDLMDAKANNPEDSRMVLGPGEHRGANVQVTAFTDEEIALVQGAAEYLWVVGRVDYTDAFNARRHTRFCHRYRGGDLGADAGTYGHYGNSYT